MLTVAQRIAKCRRMRGMSKADLAKRACLPRATITHIEQRRSNGLSTITLVKIADALNVSTDFLLGRNRRKHIKRDK